MDNRDRKNSFQLESFTEGEKLPFLTRMRSALERRRQEVSGKWETALLSLSIFLLKACGGDSSEPPPPPPPETITVLPVATVVEEGLSLDTRRKVADIRGGAEDLQLVGDDAALFELNADETAVYLKAGQQLDADANASLDISLRSGDTGPLVPLSIKVAAFEPLSIGGAATGPSGAYEVEVGDAFLGSFEPGADDLVSVTLSAGKSYVFRLVSEDGNSVRDPWLSLFDSEMRPYYNFRTLTPGERDGDKIIVTPLEDGTYFIDISDFYENAGNYLLRIEEADITETTPGNVPYPDDNPWLEGIWWGGSWQAPAASVPQIKYFLASGVNELVSEFAPFAAYPGRPWLDYEADALATAMEAWETVANVDFVRVSDEADADVLYSLAESGRRDISGYHTVPDPIALDRLNGERLPLQASFSGETGVFLWNPAGLSPGGLVHQVMLHELGHGMGLAHPHDVGGTSEIFTAVTEAIEQGLYGVNQSVYTLMSYSRGWQAQYPQLLFRGEAGSSGYGFSATPMALDVAAVQRIYGANPNHKGGNDMYLLPQVNAPGVGWRCIWDTGGTDVISAEGAASDCQIDLRAAPLTGSDPGGYVSFVHEILGGFTIANGAEIENAVGGDGDDLITGNSMDNTLTGGSGGDVFSFYGDFGADVITDFSPQEGDILRLVNAGVKNFSEFRGAASQEGKDVVYDPGAGANELTLKDVTLTELSEDDVRFAIREELDAPADSSTPYSLAMHGIAFGSVEGGPDGADWFRLDLEVGSYEFHAEGDGGANALTDPILHLYDEDGALIARVDNSWYGNPASKLSFTTPVAGTFFIAVVSGHDDPFSPPAQSTGLVELRDPTSGDPDLSYTGDYVLTVNEVTSRIMSNPDDLPDDDSTSQVLFLRDDLSPQDSFVSLLTAQDEDWIRLELDAGLQAFVVQGQGREGEVLVPEIRLRSADGNLIAEDPSASSENPQARIVRDIDSAGTYYLEIGSKFDTVGFYWLTVLDAEVGGSGDDRLTGDTGSEMLLGGAGNDILTGSSGPDTLEGGAGLDGVDYSASDAGVAIDLSLAREGYNSGYVFGTGGYASGDKLKSVENIIGSKYDDTLFGDAGPNRLEGGGGNDTLRGGADADTLDGGAGEGDWALYDDSDAGVDLTKVDSLGHVIGEGGYAEGDRLKGIENLLGSAHDDRFSGSAVVNVFAGGGGYDEVSYSASDEAVTIDLADPGDDGYVTGAGGSAEGDKLKNIENLLGSAHDDLLIGDRGRNSFEGGAGADSISGGDGVDEVSYASSAVGVTVDLGQQASSGYEGVSGGDAQGDRLKGIENLIGSANDDTLRGDGGVNVLAGGAGNDVLSGGDSDDTLDGGLGADMLDGGGGFDFADYSSSDTGVSVDFNNTELGSGRITASGADADGDVLINIEGVIGSRHDDTFIGDAGDNTFIGGAGADVFEGGGGFDAVLYHDSKTGVIVGSPASGVFPVELIFDSKGDAEGDTWVNIERFVGSAYDDLLLGAKEDNHLEGGAGDDALSGEAGADRLDGGEGRDTAFYLSSASAVTLDLSKRGGDGYATGQGGDAEGDTLRDIENIVGSKYSDKLTGDGGDNLLEGHDGADVLDGGRGMDTASYISSDAGVSVSMTGGSAKEGHAEGDELISIENLIGSAYADTLIGDAEENSLTGGGGDDFLEGGAGADVLSGGQGEDTASYQSSAGAVSIALMKNSAGSDYAVGQGGDAEGDKLDSIEHLIGSKYDDTLYGDRSGNVLEGNAGDDILRGGDGADTLIGGAGADVLDGRGGGGGDASLDTASYRDSTASVTIDLSASRQLPIEGTENSLFPQFRDGHVSGTGGDAQGDLLLDIRSLIGSEHDDRLIGNQFQNFLSGGDGDDYLQGNGGSDVFQGGAGADTLDGGERNPNSFFAPPTLSAALYEGSDAGVTIDLSATNQDGYVSGSGGDAKGDILRGIGDLVGSGHDDELSGDAGNNVLRGGAGEDTLRGGAGEDTLDGGAGADVLDGGSGNADHAIYRRVSEGESEDPDGSGVTIDLSALDQNGYVSGTGGEAEGDLLRGIEFLIGSEYDDELTGGAESDFLAGEQGDDRLFGGGGDDSLVGGSGADILDGGSGNDWADFSLDDTGAPVRSFPDDPGVTIDLSVVDDEGYATTTGPGAHGGKIRGIENLVGTKLADILVGDAEDNTFVSGGGVDTLDGGAGFDTFIAPVTGPAASFEIISRFGVAGLEINLSEVDGDGYVHYGNGGKIKNFEAIHGSGKGDVLIGDARGNFLVGGAGDDTLEGGAGADTLFGDDISESGAGGFGGGFGSGFGSGDTARYASSSGGVTLDLSDIGRDGLVRGSGGDAQGDLLKGIENIEGSAGADTLSGNDQGNTLSGGGGRDTLKGSGGMDVLQGGAGVDQLFGDDGADRLDGGDGDDMLAGGDGADKLDGGDGADRLNGGDGDDILHGGGDASVDTLKGGQGNDMIRGGAGDDTLEGGAGKDVLRGGTGNDNLAGGADDDQLAGGAGIDRFLFLDDFGSDIISDFSVTGGDIIVLAVAGEASSFEEFMTASTQAGSNLLYDFGGDGENSILLMDVELADLTASHFEFTAA